MCRRSCNRQGVNCGDRYEDRSDQHDALPGHDAKVSGMKLRIAGTDPEVGLYFVPATGDAVKVDLSDVVVNNPSELIV